MLSFINGTLIEKHENAIIVKAGGLGYQIFVSTNTLASLPYEGEEVSVFTHLNVKENEIALFGFISKEERDMFLKLISVSGVGPRSAIGVLSGLPLATLISAIATQDLAILQKIKGLGKKTAEKICVELKDKVDIYDTIKVDTSINTNALSEAIEVLVSLGISKTDATQSARRFAKSDSSTEEIISSVLTNMGR